MFAIRVVGPSGYERYWNQEAGNDKAGFLSDRPCITHDSEDDAETIAERVRASATGSGRIVDVCDLEADGG